MAIDDLAERYVNFYTDFAFKKLFGTEVNKDLLISFLNSMFDGKETIKDLTYLNTEHMGTSEFDRKAVFDVYCENEEGEKFLVEMQKGEQQYFKDRSIFYSTFPIREQAQRGTEWNYQLKAVYTIGILNFCFDKENTDNYYHEVRLTDINTGEVFYDKLCYVYLEMPKFTKKEEELETLFDKWLYAIRHLPTLLNRPQALQEKVFLRLFEVAEIAKFNKQERMEYEDTLKAYRDWFSVMETAEIKGHAKGLAEGRAEGLAEGLEKGLAEGLEKGRLEIARNLKASGMDIAAIAAATGLSAEEIDGM